MRARMWLWALLIVAALLVVARCSAAEQWSRVALADEVAVTVSQVTELELKALRHKYEERGIDRSALGRVFPQHRYGFALLFRDKETRAFRCEVYVHDTADAVTLEHELKHCHGWVHQ